MRSYILHSSLSPSTPSRAIQYDEALSLAEAGHKVYFLYCDGLLSQCFCNMPGDKAVCRICKSNFRQERRQFSDRITFIPMTRLVSNQRREEIRTTGLPYQTIQEIKELRYKGTQIGLSALSGYISYTRNLTPRIDRDFRAFFDENLRNGILTADATEEAIRQYEPDEVILYNGRFAESRPVWEIAQQRNIPFMVLEAHYGLSRNYKSKSYNSIPHAIESVTQRIETQWSRSALSPEEREAVAVTFFERRRASQRSGDKVYTANQQTGLLPDYWDTDKLNIVIFNSSEDEFASLGKEYEQYALFNSQIEGLTFLKNLAADRPETVITLRIHPNLSDIPYAYAQDLHTLEEGNFHVIPGNSPISTYTLLDHADVIVVFGSTVGIEAVYWDKPTILLAGAAYYNLGCCYIPRSPEELQAIFPLPLRPKGKEAAYKFGYYMLNEEKDYYSCLDYDWEIWETTIFGRKKRIELHNWKRRGKSRKIYALEKGFKTQVLRLMYKLLGRKVNKFVIPTAEQK